MRGLGREAVWRLARILNWRITIPKQQAFIINKRQILLCYRPSVCGATTKMSKRKVSHSCHDFPREHSWTLGNGHNQAINVKTWRQDFIRWQHNNLLEAICGISKAKQGSWWTQGSAEWQRWKKGLPLYIPLFCIFIRFFTQTLHFWLGGLCATSSEI